MAVLQTRTTGVLSTFSYLKFLEHGTDGAHDLGVVEDVVVIGFIGEMAAVIGVEGALEECVLYPVYVVFNSLDAHCFGWCC